MRVSFPVGIQTTLERVDGKCHYYVFKWANNDAVWSLFTLVFDSNDTHHV